MWLNFSSGCNATTIIIVVQFGLAMMPRGRFSASSALHSGTTNGTSSSMRNALELSIITQPCFVIVSANSFDVLPPADTNATSMSLKSSLCCNNFTSYSRPQNEYLRPALRSEPNKTSSSIGKLRSARIRRNSCPTAPLTPTIATFIFRFFNFYLFERAKLNKILIKNTNEQSFLGIIKVSATFLVFFS